jgi:fructosamine-3-kinase
LIDVSGIVQQALGKEIAAGGMRPVAGGDINDAYMVTLVDGQKVFLKVNTLRNAAFFSAEQEGLAAIRKTNAIGVPEVIATGVFPGAGTAGVGTAGNGATGNKPLADGATVRRTQGCSFLIMEYLEAGPRKADFWERFGRQLAAMHRAETCKWTPGGKYGFTQNNFIGAGSQNNAICDSWIDFFREYRLEQQFRLAGECFDSDGRKAMLSLLDHLDEYLVEPEFPSLLHGDLWGGNFVTGPDGGAWLIDPAVYVGHAEADLAMTELFGGFAPAFYGAYQEVSSLVPGYEDRRELYNLYHLLNHLNLFGEGYYGAVMRIVRRFGKVGA